MFFSASLVSALWQSVMDLFLCEFRLVSVLVVYLTGMALKARPPYYAFGALGHLGHSFGAIGALVWGTWGTRLGHLGHSFGELGAPGALVWGT